MMRRAGLLVAVVLLATACGVDKPKASVPVSPSPSPSASPSPTTPAPSPTPAASPGGAASASAAPATSADWPMYHANLAHSGVATAPPSGSGAGPVATWTSPGLDGDDHGEPLVVGGKVIAATENDSVYAFAATDGHQLWKAHLGSPVSAGSLPCGDITPVSGITSTPVADPAAGLVYVLAFVSGPTHTLFALHLSDGSVAWSRPADAPGLSPKTQQQRAALTLSAGMVLIAYGGLYGDCGTYHGAVVGIPASGSGAMTSYVVPSQNEAGIWGPSGPTVDSSGTIFVTTGNSSSSGTFDQGNAVLRLGPGLQLQSSFAPANWVALNRSDGDLGTEGPTLLAGGRLLQVGKAGVGYVVDAANLGGVGGQVASASICPSAYGGTAYVAPVAFVGCTNQLAAVTVPASGAPQVTWRASGFDAGPPIVAMGAVWTLDMSGALVELDPATGAVRHRVGTPAVAHFASPSASGNLILVPGLRAVQAFRVG